MCSQGSGEPLCHCGLDKGGVSPGEGWAAFLREGGEDRQEWTPCSGEVLLLEEAGFWLQEDVRPQGSFMAKEAVRIIACLQHW